MNELEVYNKTGAIEAQNISGALFDRFLQYLDVKPRTVETYRKAIKQFLSYLQANGITTPVREDVVSWRDSLREEHKPTTIQSYITAVKLFFSWLEQEGFYKNIAQKVKGAKIEKGHKKDYLTTEQSHRVLLGVKRRIDLKGLRDYAIIALLITTGLRTIEVVRANIEDIRTVGDSVALFVQGKGRDEKNDYVKIAPQVEEAIRAYLKARGKADEKEPLFTGTSNNGAGERMTTRSISGIVKTALREVGLDSERLTAHSLRHTAGTLALMNGAELTQVQQLLRHTNINTTMIYLHAIDRAKNNSELKVANAIF